MNDPPNAHRIHKLAAKTGDKCWRRRVITGYYAARHAGKTSVALITVKAVIFDDRLFRMVFLWCLVQGCGGKRASS